MSNKQFKINLERANTFISKNKSEVSSSPFRLKYHLMPPTGWMNDPNGFIQYKEEYHLFYQHYPYAAEWGPMHWGHAKSKDLINWEHMPVALAPSESYDTGETQDQGCFSGTAIEKDGKLFLFYTAHSIDKSPMQVQCIASSTDGINFEKSNRNPIIDGPPPSGSEDFRDPKVWEHEGIYYMIIGTGKEGTGKVVLYKSKNLNDWYYVGVFAESKNNKSDMWECPDLFTLNKNDVLIISPMIEGKNKKPMFILGKINYKENIFLQNHPQIIDYGKDFYAPQTMIDNYRRRILVGWMDMWFSKRPSEKDGWVGAMTIPRELSLSDEGRIIQQPIEETKKLRKNHKQINNIKINKKIRMNELKSKASELIINYDLNKTTAKIFGLHVRCSTDESIKTVIMVNKEKREITVDKNCSGIGEKTISKAPFNINAKNNLSLRIFIDITSIEIFINEGEQVITNRIYPKPEDQEIYLLTKEGEAYINTLDSWFMRSIYNDDSETNKL